MPAKRKAAPEVKTAAKAKVAAAPAVTAPTAATATGDEAPAPATVANAAVAASTATADDQGAAPGKPPALAVTAPEDADEATSKGKGKDAKAKAKAQEKAKGAPKPAVTAPKDAEAPLKGKAKAKANAQEKTKGAPKQKCTAKGKASGKAKAKPEPEPAAEEAGEVTLNPAIEEIATKAGLIDQLRHLATRPDVGACGIPQSDILEALQASKGLVYPALKSLLKGWICLCHARYALLRVTRFCAPWRTCWCFLFLNRGMASTWTCSNVSTKNADRLMQRGQKCFRYFQVELKGVGLLHPIFCRDMQGPILGCTPQIPPDDPSPKSRKNAWWTGLNGGLIFDDFWQSTCP